MSNIEVNHGKIDPQLIKLSNEYAIETLGWKGYAPWLYVYSAFNKVFKEGWIPDNYYGAVVVPKLKGDYGKIADLNALTHRIFESSVFPDLVYYTNGVWFKNDYQVIDEDEVRSHVFSKCDKVVYKIDNSGQGRGVTILNKENFDVRKLMFLGNGVVQRYVNQHPFFNEIMSKSVASVRLTSLINEKGETSVVDIYLRVGRNQDVHLKSSSHVRVSVDQETGKLDKHGYLANWLQIYKHPDSHFIFEGQKVPNIKEFIQLAKNLHKRVPFTRVIGWDMILDENNDVKVLEWNGAHNDIKFSEALKGPCFKDLGWEDLWKK